MQKVYKRCSYVYKNKRRCTKGVLVSNHPQAVQCAEHRAEIKRKRNKPNKKLLIFNTLCKHLRPQMESFNFAAFANVDNLINIHKRMKSKQDKMEVEEESVTQHNSTSQLFDDWHSSEAEEMDTDDEAGLKKSRFLTDVEILRLNLHNLEKLLQKYQQEKTYLEHLYEQLCVQPHVVENDIPLSDLEEIQLKAWRNYTRKHELTALIKSSEAEMKARIERIESYKTIPQFDVRGKNCIYIDGVIKCDKKRLQYSNYCKKHIVFDVEQKLFRKCGVDCNEAILDIDDGSRCILHDLINKKV